MEEINQYYHKYFDMFVEGDAPPCLFLFITMQIGHNQKDNERLLVHSVTIFYGPLGINGNKGQIEEYCLLGYLCHVVR
jgi:hypothetical protein